METPPSVEKPSRPIPPPAPQKPASNSGVSVSIEPAKIELREPEAPRSGLEPIEEAEKVVAKPRRKRRTKAEMEAERAMKAAKAAPATKVQAQEEETGKLIRVLTVHPFNIFCQSQKKLIFAGQETPVVLDAWIKNQIDKKMLVKVR